MLDRNFHASDRRRADSTPVVPFRDSSGLTVHEDRRKLPDRRLNNIQAEWVDELLLSS
jgi:hypothetical protein